MLLHLSIKNFIIIRNLELDFESGLTVFTGETGAGKSIVIDAISLICGNPSNESLIMEGESQSIIEAVIDITKVHHLFQDWSEDFHITITRVISKKNRNVAKINGQSIPLKQLQDLMKSVINIASQHEFTKFMDIKSQLALLDQFLPTHTISLFKSYQMELQYLKDIEKQIKELLNTSTEESLTDFLKFQVEDIEKQNFIASEEDKLREEKHAYKTSQKQSKDFQQLQTEITLAHKALCNSAQAIKEHFPDMETDCHSAIALTEEISHQISKKQAEATQRIDINEIESRLDIIFKYKTKYKVSTLRELVDKQNALKTQIEISENKENRLKEYELKRQRQLQIVINIAKEIHEERVKASKIASKKITGSLKDLNFDSGSCTIKLDWDETAIKDSGCSRATILIKPSEGQKEGPISEIASGGELSRVTLAIRSSLADAENIPTLIFDEIDTGVGGLTALKIGEKIQSLSAKSQVICVTHLPQIAKFANIHFSVSKNTQKSPTEMTTRLLNQKEIKQELERMIGGKEMIKNLKQV